MLAIPNRFMFVTKQRKHFYMTSKKNLYFVFAYYLALLTAFLCSANSITFRRYILKESDLHLNLNLISSVVIFCECSNTQAPTLIECEVNLSKSSFFDILYTFLAASLKTVFICLSLRYTGFVFCLVEEYC